MLVSPPNPKIVIAVGGVILTILGSILFNFLYYNLSSKYIIKPSRSYYGRLTNGLSI